MPAIALAPLNGPPRLRSQTPLSDVLFPKKMNDAHLARLHAAPDTRPTKDERRKEKFTLFRIFFSEATITPSLSNA